MNPRVSSDRWKFQRALNALVEEDSTLEIKTESADGQIILSGMSDLHLQTSCDRIVHEFKIQLEVSEPRVIYLETICKQAEGEGKYIRQTGGSGNYAHCKLRVEPNKSGKGNEFINDLKDGAVPGQYIKSIDQGVHKALEQGILAGHSMVDIRVTLFDGSYHEVDSNEMAFKIAGAIAFKNAARKALPIRLEPIMDVEITVPEDYMGAIIGDLNSRRGRIEDIKQNTAGSQVIKAAVPLAEMLGYGREIRSSTQGRAHYSMRFARYEALPYRAGPDGDGPFVTANKPIRPRPGNGFAAASFDPEFE
jgi:elongation factor G